MFLSRKKKTGVDLRAHPFHSMAARSFRLGAPHAQVLPAIAPSSKSADFDTPPPGSTVKIIVVPGPETDQKGQQQQQQRHGASTAQPPEICRVGSTAESVIDSWSPDVAKTSAGKNPYDTAPYCGDDTDEPTLRLARPASKRGNVPNFAGIELDVAAGADDGTGRVGGTDFDTATSMYVVPRDAVLSPIPSAVSGSVFDLNKPISLDDLRFEEDGGGGVCGVLGITPRNKQAAPSPSSRPAVLTSAEAERASNADNTTDDGIASSGSDTERETTGPAACAAVRSQSYASDSTEEMLGERKAAPEPAAPLDAGVAARGPPSVADRAESDRAPLDGNNSKGEPAALSSHAAAAATALRNNEAAITDNRISPFDADNATLWATAAAVALNRRSSQLQPSLTYTLRPRSRASSRVAERKPDAHRTIFWKALQRVGLVRRTPRVAPARLSPRPPAPDSSAAPLPFPAGTLRKPAGGFASPAGKPDVLVDPSKDGAPAFSTDGVFGKTPVMSPFGTGSDTDTAEEDSSSTSSAGVAARARAEVEGDLEEGGTRAADSSRAGVAASVSARVAAAEGGARAAVSEGEPMMVLPCAPSDEEKVRREEKRERNR